jgi:hypothetical protein
MNTPPTGTIMRYRIPSSVMPDAKKFAEDLQKFKAEDARMKREYLAMVQRFAKITGTDLQIVLGKLETALAITVDKEQPFDLVLDYIDCDGAAYFWHTVADENFQPTTPLEHVAVN